MARGRTRVPPLFLALSLLLALAHLGSSLAVPQTPLLPDDDATPQRFDGHLLVRVTVPSGARVSWFGEPGSEPVEGRSVRDGIVGLLERGLRLDVWGVHPVATGGWAIDVRCEPEQLQLVREALAAGKHAGVKVEVLSDNIQGALDAEWERLQAKGLVGIDVMKKKPKKPSPPPPVTPPPPSDPSEWFTEYHAYDDIVSFFKTLSTAHPDLVTYVPSIGKSYEGRDLPAVHITSVPAPLRGETPKVYWQGLIHAREWISGATVQYLAHRLVESHSKSADPDHDWALRVLNTTEFVLVPIVNPDGYSHTWKKNRLWRKNRRPVGGSVGVDINRNYPDGWGTGGGSDDPWSEAFQGPEPLSEPETQVLTKYYKSLIPAPLLAIDFHSYSQLVLRPLGWSYDPAPHEDQLREAGDLVRDAIRAKSGKRYVSEREIDLYEASGTAEDWFYSEGEGKKRAYGFTIELRPSAAEGGWGGEGFILPPESILPVGEEIWAAMMPLVDHVAKNPLKE